MVKIGRDSSVIAFFAFFSLFRRPSVAGFHFLRADLFAYRADIAIEKCSAVGAFVELRYVVVIIVAQIAYLRRSESSHDVITFLTEMIPFR